MHTIQGHGKYNGEQVTIIGSHADKLLIIVTHNPIEIAWIHYQDIDNITWIVDMVSAA